MVDTGKVTDRRKLEFDNLEQALADARICVQAEKAGKLRRTGNWTTGQLLGHLAFWIDASFDGFDMKMPFFLKFIGPLMKKMVLKRSSRAGFRLSGAPEGTYGVEVLSTDEGIRRYEAAIRRLLAKCPENPNPVFGKMTYDEWKTLHLRHAETHLSFLHPD